MGKFQARRNDPWEKKSAPSHYRLAGYIKDTRDHESNNEVSKDLNGADKWPRKLDKTNKSSKVQTRREQQSEYEEFRITQPFAEPKIRFLISTKVFQSQLLL